MNRLLLSSALACTLAGSPVFSSAHEKGSDPDAEWFASLKDKHGISCCHMQDCYRVEIQDLDIKGGHYRLKYKGEWLEVPDQVIQRDEPNPTGHPVACVHVTWKAKEVRCFIPVSLA